MMEYYKCNYYGCERLLQSQQGFAGHVAQKHRGQNMPAPAYTKLISQPQKAPTDRVEWNQVINCQTANFYGSEKTQNRANYNELLLNSKDQRRKSTSGMNSDPLSSHVYNFNLRQPEATDSTLEFIEMETDTGVIGGVIGRYWR